MTLLRWLVRKWRLRYLRKHNPMLYDMLRAAYGRHK